MPAPTNESSGSGGPIHTIGMIDYYHLEYYNLEAALGKAYCDNIAALDWSSQRRKRIKTGANQGGLLQALYSLKLCLAFQFECEHVNAHIDRVLSWHLL